MQEIISTTTKKRAFSPKYIYQKGIWYKGIWYKGIRWAIEYTPKHYTLFTYN